jgi:SSS family solute:Na+ symporter
MKMSLLDQVIIGGYGLLLLVIGLYFVRQQDSSETFFLADRSLGTFKVFGTTFSTFLGTGLIFTLAAFGYQHGVGAFLPVGAAFIGFLLFALAAPRIKRLSSQEEAITLPLLLRKQWTPKTMALASLVTAVIFATTLASNLLVVGNVLQATLDVSFRAGLIVFGLLIVGYTLFGGFRGVVWTDILQMAFIIVALVLVLPALVFLTEGTAVFDALPAGHFNILGLPPMILVVYLLIGVFSFFGSQDLYQRIYSARQPRDAGRAMLLFAVVLAVMSAVAVTLGIFARALVPGAAADQAVVALIDTIVPSGLAGFILIGVLALANSDADSQLLTVTSNVTQDIPEYFDVEIGQEKQVWIDRAVVLGIGSVALLVALMAPGLAELLGALASWFAILGLAVVATLFWDRLTDTAAFAGILIGFLAPIVFVAVTGNWQAAPLIGLLPAAITIGGMSFLTQT